MATVETNAGEQAFGHFEPALTMTVLPRCPGCGLPHPRARGLDADACPDCGTTCPSGASRVIPATLTGYSPVMLIARLFLWAGAQLARLARSL